MRLDAHTVLYGVLGSPVRHSLSPDIQNAAFEAAGLNGVYLAFETKDLPGSLAGAKALSIAGLSVTLPFKSAVIPLLDHLDPLAERIGAVNTIKNERGKLIGFNTDGAGALKALEAVTDLSGKRCLLMGAGGAARAIGYVLSRRGVEIVVANRSVDRGRSLAAFLGSRFVPQAEAYRIEADLLVQTTSVGMFPVMDQVPVSSEALREGMVVMDVIYNPLKTKLLQLAQERGCLTVSGLEMFIYQGAEQFRLWTGLEPPVEIMRAAAITKLLSYAENAGNAEGKEKKKNQRSSV
jgi:shikimate dehydrogenase